MNIHVFAAGCLVLAAALVGPTPASAVTLSEEVPASDIKVTASSEYGPTQAARHLVDGSGMSDGRHDNDATARTMWHTAVRPPLSRPAKDLPESPAWVRFEFASPVTVSEILIWNHNQAGLTNRGFRNTRVFGTADGTTWWPLTAKDVIELPAAPGANAEPTHVAVAGAARPLVAVIIAADASKGNHGGDCYGLSEVQFIESYDMPASEVPAPTAIECTARPFYRHRPDGKPGREVTVMLKGGKLYGEVKVDVDAAGERETATVPADPRGAASLSVLLPAGVGVAGDCQVRIALHSGRAELRQTLDVPAARQWTIYVLMHSHVDIGYTDVQPNIAKKQANNVARALQLIRQTKDYPAGARFKWNLEVLWPAEQFFKTATADQKKEFEQAVRDGNIGVDAMYVNLLTGVCRSEELLRQFSFATELGRRSGVAVDSMMISDVPGLTWGIVPALAQNGVKYISDGPNPFDRIGYVSVQWENRPFYWMSPSGREKVLYWNASGGYAFGHMGHGSITAALPLLLKNLTTGGYPYDIAQLRWCNGDNGQPDESVMPAVRDWNAAYASPKFVIATTSEAFRAMESRYGDKLPTFRGDFTPYWEDGVGSAAREAAMNRRSADRLVQAETLWALLRPGPFPAADFAAAWKNVAMWSEHTWGAYNSISAPDKQFVKDQWKYKQAYALDADAQAAKLLAGAMAARGPAIDGAVDVFNTASWPRTDLVTLPKETKGDRVKDDRGNAVPSQRLSTGELVFLARDIPPLSGRRFTVQEGDAGGGNAKAVGATLSTPTLTIKLDGSTGAIASLRQAGLDVELAGGQVNSYVYLPGANVKDAKPNGPAKITVKEHGPLVASLLVESDAPGANKLVREVRLVDGLDRVEIIDMVDKKAVRAIEGVHFGFAFNVPNPEVRINSPGAVARVEKDQIPGACKNWFSVERWADISNDKYGVTWSTTDAPLIEVGGLTANLPRSQPNPSAYIKTIAPSATIYSWAMNNHWHTNYRAEQEGPTLFRYAIRPHASYEAAAAARFGVESTQPLMTVMPAAGTMPTLPRLRIEPAGVIATAFKPSDDGKALIVRLYGACGTDQEAQLAWSTPAPKVVTYSDASELPGKPIPEKIPVPGWGIVTLRAELP